MKLELIRTYHPEGTNGRILHQGRLVVSTIELPWKKNHAQVSCIPEGKYELIKRWSPKFRHHLQVLNVPGRECILIHPANEALRELEGCIAPVCILDGAGKGHGSRMALDILTSLVYAARNRHEQVFLTIKKEAL